MQSIVVPVLGMSGVGKTSIIQRFTKNVYSTQHKPTLEEFYQKSILVDGKPCPFEIIDTAGSEPFEVMREMYIKTGNCFIVGYSVDSLFSFKEAQKIIQQILKLRSDKPIVFLVGTKIDLKKERIISEDVGKEIAKQKGCFFMEVSSSNNTNVVGLFSQIGSEFIKRQKKQMFRGWCHCVCR